TSRRRHRLHLHLRPPRHCNPRRATAPTPPPPPPPAIHAASTSSPPFQGASHVRAARASVKKRRRFYRLSRASEHGLKQGSSEPRTAEVCLQSGALFKADEASLDLGEALDGVRALLNSDRNQAVEPFAQPFAKLVDALALIHQNRSNLGERLLHFCRVAFQSSEPCHASLRGCHTTGRRSRGSLVACGFYGAPDSRDVGCRPDSLHACPPRSGRCDAPCPLHGRARLQSDRGSRSVAPCARQAAEKS